MKMSKMADLHLEITDYLDNTKFMIDEIANAIGCPIELVEALVEQRWADRVGGMVDELMAEPLSPFATCNS